MVQITLDFGGNDEEKAKQGILRLLAAIERGDLEGIGVVAGINSEGEEFRIPGAHEQLTDAEREAWVSTILEARSKKKNPPGSEESRNVGP